MILIIKMKELCVIVVLMVSNWQMKQRNVSLQMVLLLTVQPVKKNTWVKMDLLNVLPVILLDAPLTNVKLIPPLELLSVKHAQLDLLETKKDFAISTLVVLPQQQIVPSAIIMTTLLVLVKAAHQFVLTVNIVPVVPVKFLVKDVMPDINLNSEFVLKIVMMDKQFLSLFLTTLQLKHAKLAP